MSQHHRSSQDRTERVCWVLPRDRRRGAVYRLEHRRLPRMDVSAGGHTQSALQAGGEVGNDVAEHVVGYDYVERPRIPDHLGAEGVHVEVLSGDLWILFAYLLEDALPQAAGVSHGIGLVAHQQ